MEKRGFSRAPVSVEIEVTADGFGLSAQNVRDVSIGGVCLGPCEQHTPLGAPCQVRLFVGGRASGVCIEAAGEVVRVDDAGVGIMFTEINGTQSYHHLRQLVLLNSGDPDRAGQEFAAHVGLKSRD